MSPVKAAKTGTTNKQTKASAPTKREPAFRIYYSFKKAQIIEAIPILLRHLRSLRKYLYRAWKKSESKNRITAAKESKRASKTFFRGDWCSR
jgi:hypothetical protein